MPSENSPDCATPAAVPYGAAGATSHHIQAVQQWLDSFVLQPHPALGRDGPVCPFLGPAIRQGTLLFTEVHRTGATVPQLVDDLRGCAEQFVRTEWAGPNPVLHAMAALFPHLTDDEARLLHHAHNAIKREILRLDVMMSPFHPQCDDSASRSPELLAFRSPVPMVAIRRLAFHDILFIYQDRERFLHYARRFGRRYQNPGALDPVFVERYRAAIALHGDPDELDAAVVPPSELD